MPAVAVGDTILYQGASHLGGRPLRGLVGRVERVYASPEGRTLLSVRFPDLEPVSIAADGPFKVCGETPVEEPPLPRSPDPRAVLEALLAEGTWNGKSLLEARRGYETKGYLWTGESLQSAKIIMLETKRAKE